MISAKRQKADSLQAKRDSVALIRDSIRENTPRILETFAFPDSMQYKRIVQWTHEREFHKMDIKGPDTSYNFRFYDYPFYRKDVNATWLGVAGSPLQYYNYFNRSSENGVMFYDAYESWSYSAKTVPSYNTKTAYTELAYFGTLFANSQTSLLLVWNMCAPYLWTLMPFTSSVYTLPATWERLSMTRHLYPLSVAILATVAP